jgi:hypothetical protein
MLHRALDRGKLKEIDHSKDLGIDGSILLKWILAEWCGGTWIDLAWDGDM